ncbi:13536_t:CDS:1, partial [Funneliformis mosseae]
DSSKRDDQFNLNNSTLCPLCNENHKKESLWNDIRGEWDASEYREEQTYRIKCKDPLNYEILIVSVKA